MVRASGTAAGCLETHVRCVPSSCLRRRQVVADRATTALWSACLNQRESEGGGAGGERPSDGQSVPAPAPSERHRVGSWIAFPTCTAANRNDQALRAKSSPQMAMVFTKAGGGPSVTLRDRCARARANVKHGTVAATSREPGDPMCVRRHNAPLPGPAPFGAITARCAPRALATGEASGPTPIDGVSECPHDGRWAGGAARCSPASFKRGATRLLAIAPTAAPPLPPRAPPVVVPTCEALLPNALWERPLLQRRPSGRRSARPTAPCGASLQWEHSAMAEQVRYNRGCMREAVSKASST